MKEKKYEELNDIVGSQWENVEIVEHSILIGPKNICVGKRCVKKYLRIVCKRKLFNSDKRK